MKVSILRNSISIANISDKIAFRFEKPICYWVEPPLQNVPYITLNIHRFIAWFNRFAVTKKPAHNYRNHPVLTATFANLARYKSDDERGLRLNKAREGRRRIINPQLSRGEQLLQSTSENTPSSCSNLVFCGRRGILQPHLPIHVFLVRSLIHVRFIERALLIFSFTVFISSVSRIFCKCASFSFVLLVRRADRDPVHNKTILSLVTCNLHKL